MPNPTWPVAPFPQAVKIRFKEMPQPIISRTQMRAGVDKTRRLYSSPKRFFPVVLLCSTQEQVEQFDQFFYNTCEGGNLPFDWQHPRTGANATLRFVSIDEYEHLGGTAWEIHFTVEVMPS